MRRKLPEYVIQQKLFINSEIQWHFQHYNNQWNVKSVIESQHSGLILQPNFKIECKILNYTEKVLHYQHFQLIQEKK